MLTPITPDAQSLPYRHFAVVNLDFRHIVSDIDVFTGRSRDDAFAPSALRSSFVDI